MHRLARKLGKYNIAALAIMGVGLILFLITPLLLWLWDFDSDVLGLLIFVVGLLMLVAGLVVRRIRSNVLKGIVVGIIAIVGIGALIGIFGRLTCETPASLLTNDATEVTANSATLNGEVTDFNDAVDANVSFQWGTSPESWPNETEAESMALEDAGPFSFDLTGLKANTTYYYRAKADCGGYGTTYGDERSFTTP